MTTTQRPFAGEADLLAMAALARAFPADNLHVVDLPYRFSSWAFDEPDNVGLWVNQGGQLVAWAVMQTPFWAIDYACHPQTEAQLHRPILAWANRRARQVLDTPSGRPSWFVNVLTGQTGRLRDLLQAGFASQSDVSQASSGDGDDPWSKVLMRRPAETPLTVPSPPAGFVVRPLAGEREVDAYVELHQAVFESRSMTVEWRRRTLRRPEYLPELDLVAVAPNGRLAAFCIGWLQRTGEGATGQIEPLGVDSDFRGIGLGQAILAENLRRLVDHGAGSVLVETDNYRNAAFELYRSAGFRVIQDVLVFRQDYAHS